MRLRKIKKITVLIPVAALFAAGASFGLNGWFGGGSDIPTDTMSRGLVGYWNFEEGFGNKAYDSSDNGNAGTLTYMTTSTNAWTRGKVGSALQFDGVDDYVDVTDNSALAPSNITVEAWIKTPTIATEQLIASKFYEQAGFKGWYFEIYQSKLLFAVNGNVSKQGNTALSSNTWYHAVAVYDGSTISLYYNSIFDGSLNTTGGITNPTGNLNIGRYTYTGDYWFNGLIDEVRIYNRALSGEEIRYHYNRGGPAAHWKFDEGSGTTAYDSTDNNNDGTLTYMSTSTGGGWTTGKYGSALSFDGVDDYVIKSSFSNIPTGAYMVSAWIKLNELDREQHIMEFTNTQLYVDPNNNLLRVGTGNPQSPLGTTSLQRDRWYFVTVIYNSAGGAGHKIYLDGKLEASSDVSGPFSPISNFYVGVVYSLASGYFFNGIIDDVRIYNYARTAEEIRLDYNSGFAAHFGPKTNCNQDPGSCMTQGLSAYWNFDDGLGAIAYDASDYGNNASFTNTPNWATGKKGGTLDFDGTNDCIVAPDSASLDIGTNDFTIEAWVKRDVLGVWQIILRKDDAAQTTGYEFYLASDNKVTLYITSSSYQSSGTITDSDWHYVAVSATREGKATFYIDGIESGSSDISGSVGDISNTWNLGIGSNGTCGGDFFNGKIDEVRIYSRALSSSEIRYHYNRGGPVAHWKFDEGSGTTAYDFTENNNDGTMYYMSTSTSGGWAEGKYGTALSFDGADDYINTGDGTTLDITGAITIEAWIKKSSSGLYWIAGRDDGTNRSFGFQVQATDELNFFRVSGNSVAGRNLVGITGLQNNTWYHVAALWDGTTQRIFLNGREDSILSDNQTTDNDNVSFTIGARKSLDRYFNGTIDDVRIYNYARTAEEIRLDYNSGFAAHFGPKTNCNQDSGSCMNEGLVGYWNFDEKEGLEQTAYDGSNYGNNGTLGSSASADSADPQRSKGKVSSALQFDGTDDYVRVAHNSTIEPTEELTYSAWIKTPDTNDMKYIMAKNDGNVADYRTKRLLLYYGNIQAQVYNGTAYNFTTSGVNLQNNTWYFVTLTIKDNSFLKIYINGTEQYSSTTIGDLLLYDDEDFLIGAALNTNNISLPFNGLIDEVRIYNRVLSAEEIRYHYNRGGPVAYWKFNEASGSTAYDSTENDNDGTMYYMSTSTSGGWAAGKFGSALSFDGVDDYINAGENSSQRVANITIEAWIKPEAIEQDNLWIAAKDDVSTNRSYVFGHTSGKIYGGIFISNAWTSVLGNTALNNGAWYHVVMIYDGSSEYVYLNGMKDGVKTGLAGNIDSDQANLFIGSREGTGGFFKGIIDDLRIYNYARTPEQIRQDYNAGLSAHFR